MNNDLNSNDLRIIERIEGFPASESEPRLSHKLMNKYEMLPLSRIYGKYLCLVKYGILKITRIDNDGSERIRYLVGKGGFLGEFSIFESAGFADAYEDAYARVLEPCWIQFISMEKIKRAMISSSDVRDFMLSLVVKKIRIYERLYERMLIRDVRLRVMGFLMEVAREFGTLHEDVYTLNNFLTHEDIASAVNSTRQTVTKILNELREKGFIEYNVYFLKIILREDEKCTEACQ